MDEGEVEDGEEEEEEEEVDDGVILGEDQRDEVALPNAVPVAAAFTALEPPPSVRLSEVEECNAATASLSLAEPTPLPHTLPDPPSLLPVEYGVGDGPTVWDEPDVAVANEVETQASPTYVVAPRHREADTAPPAASPSSPHRGQGRCCVIS